MNLPPYKLITTPTAWRTCLEHLQAGPRLALDLEANSMYAYREQVCLIQVSVAHQDYIIDPLADLDLGGLGQIVQDPTIEKVLHAAEYDLILMKREYGWDLHNLFDTMWAARILGYPRMGLANILDDLYQAKLNKRFQKANWCRRPLSKAQLTYAQSDTHYLLPLRDHLAAQLESAGRLAEAKESFAEQSQVTVGSNEFDPNSFWSINGVYDLSRQEQAILKALNIYRDQQAKERNQPLFKIFGDKTLLQLAQAVPERLEQLQEIHGMTRGQIRRYGRQLLHVIQEAKRAIPPSPPRRNSRPPEAFNNRYEKLHTWRKERAIERGVESDVILSREGLWAIAQANPKTAEELANIRGVGAWRCQEYGQEILAVLNED